jgi:hypothetical protein
MIEDPGPLVTILIGAIALLCFAFAWIQHRGKINLMQAGHLYLMYFWGAHTAHEVMNEIDPTKYSVTAVYWDLRKLEKLGYVERAPEYDDVGEGRYGHSFEMTDAGEAAYHKYADRFDLPDSAETRAGLSPTIIHRNEAQGVDPF